MEEQFNQRSLIEAAQAGDKSAFGQLIRQFQQRLMRFVYGLLGSFDQAEDVVQEAFVKAWQAIATFDPSRPFYPWLSVIARNLAFNQIRREEKKESLEKLTEKGFDAQSDLPGPLDVLLDGENEQRFYKALSSMPTAYREVFVLRHFEDMNYADIAKELKIKPGTVDSRLYRARQYLLEQLGDLLSGAE
jgi:RNA polymerase sigma-70 factor (ECF subfamily)